MTDEEIVIEGPTDNPIAEEPKVEGDKDDEVDGSIGDESNSTCTICMEDWTIGSEHRLCCLRCGHMFGRSCIERWIKEKGSSAKCPTCNKPAKKVDLRDLWCKAIKATDNTEFYKLQKLLENERKLRQTDAAILFQQNMRIEMLHSDVDRLKKMVKDKDEKIEKLERVLDRFHKLRAQSSTTGCATNDIDNLRSEVSNLISGDDDTSIQVDVDVEPKELKGMFHFAEDIEQQADRCTSFTLCPTASILLVTQSAPYNARSVFGGFGVRKFSTLDTNVREFIPLHANPITSIKLKPIGDLFLTSSLDRRVKLTSVNNNTCVQSYQCQFEPTAISWSTHRDQQFYVGSGNCHVTLFDIRNTSEYIYQKKVATNTRLMSIASTTGTFDGLLVNDAKGSQVLEISSGSDYNQETIDRSAEHFVNHQLPFDGMMGAADFYKPLNLSLVTTRKNPRSHRMTHTLFKLDKTFNENGEARVNCTNPRTFVGGPTTELFGYSRILKHPTLSDSVLVSSCDQTARGIKLWDLSDVSEYQDIKTDVFIRDVIMYSPENSNQHMLYTLHDKGIKIYRWDYA